MNLCSRSCMCKLSVASKLWCCAISARAGLENGRESYKDAVVVVSAGPLHSFTRRLGGSFGVKYLPAKLTCTWQHWDAQE